MNEATKAEITEIISEVTSCAAERVAAADDNMPLSEIGLDSLAFIRMIVLIEDRFGIEIRDSDLLMSKFVSLSVLYSTLDGYIKRKPLKKAVVCDCDGVLWHGISGEEEICCGEDTAALHEALLSLYRAGVYICICSKNTKENIDAAFASLKAALRLEYIVSSVTGCENKAEGISSLADSLGIDADSFVFLDDSDYELGLVSALMPQVDIIKADRIDADFIGSLYAYFGEYQTTELNRTELYREQKEREQERVHFATAEEFNASLRTVFTCGKSKNSDAARIAELSQRTNRFNLSGERYTETDIESCIQDSRFSVLSLSVSDKYGDMGLVGAAVVRFDGEHAVIESFFLSCRVFGRSFEKILLDEIKNICAARGCGDIRGVFRDNGKNSAQVDFYTRNGVCQ